MAATILIVDDSPVGIEFLNGVLENDYDVLFSTNGPDALEIAEEEQPQLILLDVMMPEMDGYEVCTRLKENEQTKHIPIIFMTGMTQTSEIEHGISLGAVDYLTKPISISALRQSVTQHILK